MGTSNRKFDLLEAAQMANEDASCTVKTGHGIEFQWAWKNGVFETELPEDHVFDEFIVLREIMRSARTMRGMDFLPALDSQKEIITAIQIALKGIKVDQGSEIALGGLKKGLEALLNNNNDMIKEASPKD